MSALPSRAGFFLGVLGLILAIAVPGIAAPGDLDPTFDGDGRVTTDVTGEGESASGMAIQEDGKIVVVGTAPGDDFALVRYNTDGSLDTSFDGDGKIISDLTGSDDRAFAVAIQPDGGIVAAGYTVAPTLGTYNFALARYQADGSLDTTFDGDGKVVTDFGGGDNLAFDVKIQADGKILAAGEATVTGSGAFALARYSADGSLDTTFDEDGMVTTDFGGNVEEAFGLALQSNGKIVAAGRTYIFSNEIQDFALVRYNIDGSLDTTFDGDGRVITDFMGGVDFASDVVIQGDGKIVAAGNAATPGSDDFGLSRYNIDGSLDTTFDGDGKATTDFDGFADQAGGLAIQTDGKIVAAGCSHCFTIFSDFALARFNTNGSLDNTFNGDGEAKTDFAGSYDGLSDVAIQADGKIAVAGFASRSGSRFFTVSADFGLARYTVCRRSSRTGSAGVCPV